MIDIIPLTDCDVEIADEILSTAFGDTSSRKTDLCRVLALQPDGWWLAKYNGQPAGMGGAILYGSFAYIVFMAVHPAYQYRGIGRAMMDHVLGWIERAGIPVVVLDASPAGYPLYLKAGFVEEDETRLFRREETIDVPPGGAFVRPMEAQDLPAVTAFDAHYFGGRRETVLRTYWEDFPGRSFVTLDASGNISGFTIAQSARIGPWVAADVESAQALLAAVLALPVEEPQRVILPTSNEAGAELLVRAGFMLQNTNRHMRLGGDRLPGSRTHVYGQAGMSIG